MHIISPDSSHKGATALSIATLGIMTFNITTLSIKGLSVTLSISDTHHNNALPLP